MRKKVNMEVCGGMGNDPVGPQTSCNLAAPGHRKVKKW